MMQKNDEILEISVAFYKNLKKIVFFCILTLILIRIMSVGLNFLSEHKTLLLRNLMRIWCIDLLVRSISYIDLVWLGLEPPSFR